jgi:alpha-tubulin suppressor-like RCC1 family protein
MLIPKSGRIGAMLSAVTMLIGIGLLLPPAASFDEFRVALPVPVAAGDQHSLAVASDGTLWHWGMNVYQDARSGAWILQQILQPQRVDNIDGVVAAVGKLALKSDGTVWAIDYPEVRQVAGLSDIVIMAVGQDDALALKADGTVWQLDPEMKPTQVPGLTDIVSVAIGAHYSSVDTSDGLYHATALKEDGTVWTWTDPNKVEVKQELTDVVAIAAGFDHQLAIKSDGTVWAWGSNTCGQTGGSIPTSIVGSPVPDYVAHQVEGIGNVTAISAGGGEHFFSFGHSLALKSDGTVWEWGCDGTAHFNPTPKQVDGLTGGLAIAAGAEHSLVLKEDGTVNAWGWNYYGQLGDGTRTYTFSEDSVIGTPVQVIGLPSLIINYYNEYGRPYTKEEYGFWYNQNEQQWYQGTKSTGQIIPIALPPWKEENAP